MPLDVESRERRDGPPWWSPPSGPAQLAMNSADVVLGEAIACDQMGSNWAAWSDGGRVGRL